MPRSPARSSWFAVLLLLGCGGDAARPRACDRLGLLCSDDSELRTLGLTRARSVSADLDGDGVLDLVTAGSLAGLSIAWGQSGRRDYRLFAGRVPDAKIGDVDGDGRLDIVYLTDEPAALHVLRGAGGQALVDGPSLALAGRPQGLWLGQLDADGRLDAVVASDGESTLTVITDGLTRAEPITLGRGITRVDAGDLNNDGKLDLIALDTDDAAYHVLLADGERFAAPRRVATGLGPAYLQLHDLDDDGELDVLTQGKGPEIWFHQGDGAGGFAPAHALVVQEEASPGFAVHRDDQGRRWLINIDYANITATRLGDDDQVAGRVRAGGSLKFTSLDVDGDQLLVQGPWYGRRFSLVPAVIFSELWHGGTYSEDPLLLADLDLDGTPELVTTQPGQIVIYQQQPDATWAELPRLELDAPTIARAVADFTGDGLPDLALVDATDGLRLAIASADAGFTLTLPAALPTSPAWLRAAATPAGAALVFTSQDPDQPGIFALTFDADGLASAPSHPLPDGVVTQLTAADLDADGRDDLVAVVRTDDTLSLAIVPAVADGWGPPRTLALNLPPDVVFSNPKLAVGDLDLDGKPDAVLAEYAQIVRYMDLSADPPPEPQVDEVTTYTHDTIAIADADADGRPDLVSCTYNGLGVLLATDDGWQAEPTFDSYFNNCTLHAADGLALAALADSGALTLLAPDHAVAFVPNAGFDGGPTPFTDLVTGDMDADGRTDLALTTSLDPSGDTPTGSFAVLWGSDDLTSQRATWREGNLFDAARPLFAPLDDQPGDELLLAWRGGSVEAWTHDDGALRRSFRTLVGATLFDIGVQTRARGRSDVVVMAALHGDPTWQVIALPRAASGEFVDPAGFVTLWSAPVGKFVPTLTIADFDADGTDDIVVHSSEDLPVQLLWGDEPRAPVPQDIPSPGGTFSAVQADMDGDGVPELVLGTNTGTIGYRFRDRVPELVRYGTASTREGLLIADLEDDGRADILRNADSLINVTLRSPHADDERVQLDLPYSTWRPLRAATLDDDDVLDLVGLVSGYVVTRRSAPRAVDEP